MTRYVARMQYQVDVKWDTLELTEEGKVLIADAGADIDEYEAEVVNTAVYAVQAGNLKGVIVMGAVINEDTQDLVMATDTAVGTEANATTMDSVYGFVEYEAKEAGWTYTGTFDHFTAAEFNPAEALYNM